MLCNREGQGPGIVLAGKQLEVDIALVQEDARSLASGKVADRHPTDRRNLYLVRLPKIMPLTQDHPPSKELVHFQSS